MVRIRPFRLMLWSLLLITIGGSLIVYGQRVRQTNHVTYSQMIEGMADMSKSRATQDNPPVLEIWDMGWMIMCIGVTVAVPGAVLMFSSGATMMYHKWVPEKPYVPFSKKEDDSSEADEPEHEPELETADEPVHELGEELLGAADQPAKPVAAASPVVIELDECAPVDLVEPQAKAADQIPPAVPPSDAAADVPAKSSESSPGQPNSSDQPTGPDGHTFELQDPDHRPQP